MTDADRTVALRGRLERFGDPRETWQWETGEVDYVAQLELTAGDVPQLLAVAKEWAQEREWPEDENDMSCFAPVHAWRGLAQLGAVEAVGVLLEMMDPLDVKDDDWYLEEFAHVFAWIGPVCLPALGDYLADAAHLTYPRTAASNGLKELAKRHPEAREGAVEALCRTLRNFRETDQEVNAFIIADLLDLKATEAAELIERAYAADCVEIGINGNWKTVREELGVPGLGLVPEELAGMEWGWSFDSDTDKDREDAMFLERTEPERQAEREDGDSLFHGGARTSRDDRAGNSAVPLRSPQKVGRNEPCPCGSGKKFKKCCGR